MTMVGCKEYNEKQGLNAFFWREMLDERNVSDKFSSQEVYIDKNTG